MGVALGGLAWPGRTGTAAEATAEWRVALSGFWGRGQGRGHVLRILGGGVQERGTCPLQ